MDRCRCLTCRTEAMDARSVATRVVHDRAHREFREWLGDRPDPRGFTPPTYERYVQMRCEEWAAPEMAVVG